MSKKRLIELTGHKNSLNKLELCTLLSEEMNIPIKDAQAILRDLLGLLTEAMMDDRKVLISDFGVFQVTHRDSFDGYNPHSKQRIEVPARTIPSFKAGKKLKRRLNPDS